MSYQTIIAKIENHVLTVTLNRPDVRNAFNETLISELTHVFGNEALSNDVKVVLLKGCGKVFCAGGDLNWMKQSLSHTKEENFEDAHKLSSMLSKINHCPKPVIASIHGAAMGGGFGLVSVCDYVVASPETVLSLSEVRLGLIPAVVGPFVYDKIGQAWARALFLSADKLTPSDAKNIGLVHAITKSADELEKTTQEIIANFLTLSPQALRIAKHFIFELHHKPDAEKAAFAAKNLADIRVTPEAQEGIKAFLEKRKPNW